MSESRRGRHDTERLVVVPRSSWWQICSEYFTGLDVDVYLGTEICLSSPVQDNLPCIQLSMHDLTVTLATELAVEEASKQANNRGSLSSDAVLRTKRRGQYVSKCRPLSHATPVIHR